MSTDPRWVPLAAIRAIHDRQIQRHGGSAGTRDPALVEMGASRPLNLWAYGTPDLYDLAGAYAFGIAKAHAFVDGNKRTALVTALTFLRLNGVTLVPDQRRAVAMMEALAESRLPEAEFAAWLRAGAVAR